MNNQKIQCWIPFNEINIHPAILEQYLEKSKERIYDEIIELFPAYIKDIISSADKLKEIEEENKFDFRFRTIEEIKHCKSANINRKFCSQVSRTTIDNCLIFVKAQLLIFFEMIYEWIEEDKKERAKLKWDLIWIDYPELIYFPDSYQMSIKCSFYLVENDAN